MYSIIRKHTIRYSMTQEKQRINDVNEFDRNGLLQSPEIKDCQDLKLSMQLRGVAFFSAVAFSIIQN